jgi:hypothetical protein
MNDTTKSITNLQDKREFGNITEEHLTKSAVNFITAISRAIMKNRTINGFTSITLSGRNVILSGGTALIDGKIVEINNTTTRIPILREAIAPAFNTFDPNIDWLLCANSKGQIELIADTAQGALADDRIFYVKNPNVPTPTEYPIRATTLADLTNNFHDVTPLYRISAVATGSGTNWTLTDPLTSTDVRVIVARI